MRQFFLNAGWIKMINGDVAELYLEAHVTIEPIFDEQLEKAKEIAAKFNFRVAELLMKKRSDDTETRSKYDTFMTGHSKSLKDINSRIVGLVSELKANDYKCWRYKVEDTLHDSRHYDTLGLLDVFE